MAIEMSNPNQPPNPPYQVPPTGTQQPPPPAKPQKVKRFGWVALIVTALVALVIGSLLGGAGDSPTPGTAPITTATATEGAGEPTSEPEEPTEEPAQEGYTPKKSDWTLKLKTTDKQCFGSAGCNVTVRVSPEYSGAGTVATLPNSGTIDITYKLSGDESGPIVGTATVQLADETVQDQEESLSTRSSGTKVTASVTDVEYNEWG